MIKMESSTSMLPLSRYQKRYNISVRLTADFLHLLACYPQRKEAYPPYTRHTSRSHSKISTYSKSGQKYISETEKVPRDIQGEKSRKDKEEHDYIVYSLTFS